MRRADSLEKTLILGKTEGKEDGGNRGWDGWVASLIQRTWVWASSGRQWRIGKPAAVHGITKSWTRLSDWTTTTAYLFSMMLLWLILCANTYSDIWSSITPDISVKLFFRWTDFEQSRLLSIMQMGLVESAEGLKRRGLTFREGEEILPADPLQT